MFYGAGSWAEYCVVSETALVAVPDNVPDEIAAQFFVSHLCAPLAPQSHAPRYGLAGSLDTLLTCVGAASGAASAAQHQHSNTGRKTSAEQGLLTM